MENNENDLHHPHDKLIRNALKRREVTVNLLQKAIPPKFSAKINFESLILENTSFIDASLEEHYADLVYSCLFGNERIFISFLFEHKSSPDEFTYFQTSRYQSLGWDAQIKQGKKPLRIVPIIIYHGNKKWNVKPIHKYWTETEDEDIAPYLPKSDCIFINLRDDYTEEKILTIGDTFLVNTFLLLKFGNQKKYVELNYAKFFTFDPQYFQDQAYKELVKIIVRYMLAIKTLEKEKFIELTNKLPEDMKNLIEEDYNYFQLDGMEKGLEKGMEKGMEKEKNTVIKTAFQRGMSAKTIAFLVNLTTKEVENRIKEMKLTRQTRSRIAVRPAN
jgi:predicted transposase/invertase (TIGR01784 family)